MPNKFDNTAHFSSHDNISKCSQHDSSISLGSGLPFEMPADEISDRKNVPLLLLSCSGILVEKAYNFANEKLLTMLLKPKLQQALLHQ